MALDIHPSLLRSGVGKRSCSLQYLRDAHRSTMCLLNCFAGL
jgi:hypothetical protein